MSSIWWVAADQARDMWSEVTCDGQLAPVERRVSEPVDAGIGIDFQGDEVTPRGCTPLPSRQSIFMVVNPTMFAGRAAE